jgi:hypothetical protein
MAYYSPLFPDPVTYTVNITKQFKDEMVNRFPPSGGFMPWLKETLELYHSLFYFGLSEIAHILLIAGGLTLLRVILNRFVFKVRVECLYVCILDISNASLFPCISKSSNMMQ